MKICITGGGTGGHLMIAQALAEAAQELQIQTIFIGSTSGQDQKYFKQTTLFEKTFFLETTGVVNKKFLNRLIALWKVFKAFLQARRILQEENIKAVYSVGGFSAAPASFAALTLKIPLYIHEQNAKTGKLNALLKKYATEFICSYDPNSPIREYPVRDIFFDRARLRKKIATIIFLGGSQGARFINELALNVAPALQKKGIKIIHQTGDAEYEKVQQHYKKLRIDAEVFPFDSDISRYMKQADLAVSRSGASTLWELVANGLPALFIPYPYAAGDHQYYNALYLKEKELGWVVRQEEQPAQKLLEIIDEDLERKSATLLTLTQKGVAKKMLDNIVKKVHR